MPASIEVVVDVALTRFVRTYPYAKQRFVADEIAPRYPATSFKGTYKELGHELQDMHVSDTAAEKSPSNEIGHHMTEASFQTEERRLRQLVTDKEIRNAPSGYDPMKQAAVNVTHALKMWQEYRIVALASATSYTSTPANDWNLDAATIVSDVNAGIAAFKSRYGDKPNRWLIPDHVADEIAAQQDIIDVLKTAAALQQPYQMLNLLHGGALPSVMFGMQVVVPTVRYNDAAKGATRNVVNMWGDDSYMFAVDPSGMGATWAIQPESVGFTIVKWRAQDPGGWYVKAVWERDEIEVTPEAIHKFVDVT